MSCREELCALPPEPPAGCCAPPEPVPAAPVMPVNPPGRDVIAYRVGTFSSFRRAMLAQLAADEPSWSESSGLDYQVAIVELWAYLADVLTFYQERVANEAFIATATQRDSVRRLAELLGYEPTPAVGAVGVVAFTVEKGKIVALPPGFRIGSRAAPGQPAAVFETVSGLNAVGDYSAIPMATRAPTRQFADLNDYALLFGANLELREQAAARIFPTSLALQCLGTFAWETAIELVKVFAPSVAPPAPTRDIVLSGLETRLKAGDSVLVIVNADGASPEQRFVCQVNRVAPDKGSGTTTIRIVEPENGIGARSDDDVEIYALRVTASAFGHDAPAWALLPPQLTNNPKPPSLTNPNPGFGTAPYPDNWDLTGAAATAHHLPSPGGGLLLDAVYVDAHGVSDATTRRWAVVQDGGGTPQIVAVASADAEAVTAYSLNGKVTRLVLGESLGAGFGFRTTTIRAGSEQLAVEPNLPLGTVLGGTTLILDGSYPKLRADQEVAVRGPQDSSPTDAVVTEVGVLQDAPVVDEKHGVTTIVLKHPLEHSYVRAATVLLANLVAVTQGETVHDEVLGGGDGSAFQTFGLSKSPLTYLPATDPEGLSTVESTLTLTVNRRQWGERPTLIGDTADDQAYQSYERDDEKTVVQFGDGTEGARPPSGLDNIHARYRKGAGSNGNVATGAVERLIDNRPGVQKVLNPAPTAGGDDRETVDGIRSNAPASVSTFGRAVSASDYAALAVRYPGIGKARAVWIALDPVTHVPTLQPYVALTVASADGTDLSSDSDLMARLRAFLDGRRDPNVPLRIQDVTRVPVEVIVEIDVDDHYGRSATLAAAIATLDPITTPGAPAGFFAFARLDFGGSVHLSAVYAAVQAAVGVSVVRISTMRRCDVDPPGTVREHILLPPTEIASVVDDPVQPELGRIVVSLGAGGFDDS